MLIFHLPSSHSGAPGGALESSFFSDEDGEGGVV
jgi:hypothetical protein